MSNDRSSWNDATKVPRVVTLNMRGPARGIKDADCPVPVKLPVTGDRPDGAYPVPFWAGLPNAVTIAAVVVLITLKVASDAATASNASIVLTVTDPRMGSKYVTTGALLIGRAS